MWEYKIDQFDTDENDQDLVMEELNEWLNQLGYDSWELCHAEDGWFIFKRRRIIV